MHIAVAQLCHGQVHADSSMCFPASFCTHSGRGFASALGRLPRVSLGMRGMQPSLARKRRALLMS